MPNCWSRVSQPSKAPGTQAGSNPVPGTSPRPRSSNDEGVARAGAVPWPQTVKERPVLASQPRTGTSPAGPLRCGSTTCSTNPAAVAASKALPPFSSTAIALCEASQWVEATMP